MKRMLYITLTTVLVASPAHSDPKNWEELRKGLENLSQGTQEFFESWVDDLGPMLNSLRDKVDNLKTTKNPKYYQTAILSFAVNLSLKSPLIKNLPLIFNHHIHDQEHPLSRVIV